ncbi:YpjP family protein [Kurthia sibirica]|uniref:Cell division protein FtsK n=1 Tax=Kurthia sibirica TaxID=202750 RepID=A0A2U3APG3_9BACL|nr:YpjP family protein [Kurthia sibirica]PWI26414.1 hypothetical protein DEX24_03510 [Kurthia sibirica]GEK32975.1 cell division protein FtsK [Kurthia sibirica]
MKNWIQKFLVSAVAVVTLGVITPSHTIWNNLIDEQASAKSQYADHTVQHKTTAYIATNDLVQEIDLIAVAKDQAYQKFGTKIGPKIQDDFDTIIFPKMQQAMDDTLINMKEKMDSSTIAITENPSGNYSEKIFNMYNVATGEDLIRFHVRTENRPFDGYYYNFHYHASDDDFVSHHDLGELYWSKNTPPKWLS